MHSIPLSPVDLIFTGRNAYPIEFGFVFERHLDAEKIKSSLAVVLKDFLPLRGTLEKSPDKRFAFLCDDERYTFEVQTSDLDFAKAKKIELYSHLDSVESLEGEPLLKVKLVQGKTGSLLMVSASHVAVDGYSYFFFLTSWAKVAAGLPITKPSHQRETLIPNSIRLPDDGTFNENLVRAQTGIHWKDKRKDIEHHSLQWGSELFSQERQRSFLADVPPNFTPRLSFNDVLCAYLWKTYVPQWKGTESSERAFISCPVDLRRTLKSTSPLYFGNAVCLATAEATYKELEQLPLYELGARIRKAINNVTAAFAENAFQVLEGMCRELGAGVFEEFHVAHPTDGLLVTNLSRLPYDELNFGSGAPARIEIMTPAVRGGVVLPAGDSIEVQICSTKR